jgi:hypothetical protein
VCGCRRLGIRSGVPDSGGIAALPQRERRGRARLDDLIAPPSRTQLGRACCPTTTASRSLRAGQCPLRRQWHDACSSALMFCSKSRGALYSQPRLHLRTLPRFAFPPFFRRHQPAEPIPPAPLPRPPFGRAPRDPSSPPDCKVTIFRGEGGGNRTPNAEALGSRACSRCRALALPLLASGLCLGSSLRLCSPLVALPLPRDFSSLLRPPAAFRGLAFLFAQARHERHHRRHSAASHSCLLRLGMNGIIGGIRRPRIPVCSGSA